MRELKVQTDPSWHCLEKLLFSVIRGWWNELRFCQSLLCIGLCSIKSLPWIKALYMDLMQTLKLFQWHSKLGIRAWADGSDSNILFWGTHVFVSSFLWSAGFKPQSVAWKEVILMWQLHRKVVAGKLVLSKEFSLSVYLVWKIMAMNKSILRSCVLPT